MRLPEFTRTTTFRWTLVVSGALALCIPLMFAFAYWQTAAYMTAKIDEAITAEVDIIAADAPGRRLDAIDERLRQDPRRVKLAALFGSNGAAQAGNLEAIPAGLEPGGRAQSVLVFRVDAQGREHQNVRAVARRLQSEEMLVIGRNIDELSEIADIVKRALVVGLIPALILGLAAGMFLSLRAQKRVEDVTRQVERIVAGELRERLPTRGRDDPFDKLASIVNGMLEEIEALIQRVSGIGDDIAHDLRTPLTRVRISLERGRKNAQTLEQLQTIVDQGIHGLDQSLAIVTALLRIAEIEQSRRTESFGEVRLANLVREVGELYQPIAEDKRVKFMVTADEEVTIRGDRDLLFEALANLVDNAVKFTPEGGNVELTVHSRGRETVLRVRDSGAGIAQREHTMIGKRFYRSDTSRNTEGLGLGLSLVTAIAKLHGFRFTISSGPGCIAELSCGVRT